MVKTYGEMLRKALEKIEKNDAWALLAAPKKTDRAGVISSLNAAVPPHELKTYSSFVNRRAAGEPVAYITGVKEFYSLDFIVNPSVLIPRPETELLVDWAKNEARGKRLLDLCCGSGCVGIAVAVNCGCSLTMADISPEALYTARQNAEKHKIKADFVKIDILNEEINGEYDVIVSNPPYVPSDTINTLDIDVKCFEPIIALDGGQNGLDFYPVIIKKAHNALAGGGKFAAEIGHDQGAAVKNLFEKYFKNVKVLKDLAHNDRVVFGSK